MTLWHFSTITKDNTPSQFLFWHYRHNSVCPDIYRQEEKDNDTTVDLIKPSRSIDFVICHKYWINTKNKMRFENNIPGITT